MYLRSGLRLSQDLFVFACISTRKVAYDDLLFAVILKPTTLFELS